MLGRHVLGRGLGHDPGGLAPEAGEIGQSLVNTIWNTDALWFRTPEAWDVNGKTRAEYYMRATTLWAAKRAYDITP